MNETPSTIETVAEKLVANGASYVAATEPSLADESAQLIYHTPVGTPDDQKETIHEFLDEVVGHQPERQIGAMEVDGETIPTCVNHVLHGDLHLYRRVPVYIGERIPGLDPVPVESGVEKVRNTLGSEVDLEPLRVETTTLRDLLEELADAGAGSVELAREFLVSGDEPQLHLRVPIIPADGKPIVAPIESVEIGGQSYPLCAELTLEGPHGTGAGWTGLYVGDNVNGLVPMSVDEGVEVARDLLTSAEEAESLRELELDSTSSHR